LEEIATKNPENIVYIDESGIDDNEEYPYAWGKKGERIYAMKSGVKRKRLSIIGSLNQNILKAPFVFEGSCTRDVFEIYLSEILLPYIKPGQTIVMDNASFHKGGKIKSIIESAGCELTYLPAYSPDLNPIEHWWSPVKHRIKQALPLHNRDIYKAAEFVFPKLSRHG
jgi:transposase